MRHAIVIGAGLAGAAVCERLCTRGWRVTLIERHAAPAAEASGNHAGSFHPLIARDGNRMARLTQAGVTYALDYWRTLEATGAQFGWQACGALQLSRGAVHGGAGSDPAVALEQGQQHGGQPGPHKAVAARAVARDGASALAGVALAGGGVFFEDGGWVRPAELVAAQLARCSSLQGTDFVSHFGRAVGQVRRSGGDWQVLDAAGVPIAAAAVVIAAGGASADVARWFGQSTWPIDSVRGRLTVIDARACVAPRLPVHRDGYVLPAIDGCIVAGASYERDGALDASTADRDNLRRLARLLQLPDGVPMAPLPQSRSASRAVALDRLPVVGALPDPAALTHALVTRKGVRLSDLPRLAGAYVAGAYASRGLTWAALGAEVLACIIEGNAPPLDGNLVESIDPARFAFRALRRAGA